MSTFPSKYWHTLPNTRVQCDVCPQACKLNEGQRGVCGVRRRDHNQIVLITYGRPSGMCIDPIEKKPLYHFLPGSTVLSFGTVGCNLTCKFCQNCDISNTDAIGIPKQYVAPASIAEAAASNANNSNCKSVAFTYNEPTTFMEYAIDVATECHARNLKTIAVTNGYICPAPRTEFYNYIDAANVDLKGFSDKFYQEIAGATLQPVLDTLVYLKHHTKVWLEITTLLIPDENDSVEEIKAEVLWIKENLGIDVPLHFTAFHPAWKMQNKPTTPLATLQMARAIGVQNGLRYVYAGNVYYPEGNATYCHQCGKIVIARDGFGISEYHLTNTGKCKFCSTQCAGRFAD